MCPFSEDGHRYAQLLPKDILAKVVLAAMASSLDILSTFLDHRVAEVAWDLLIAIKIYPIKSILIGKWNQCQILCKHASAEFI